jgi:glycosyltransferase involved in cell wall biosynthesis
MRVAYVCADFGVPLFGAKGSSVHMRELTSALTRLGHEVLVVTPRAEGDHPPDYAPSIASIELEEADRRVYELLLRDGGAGAAVAREVRALLYAGTLRRHGSRLLEEFRPGVVVERYSLLGGAGIDLARALDVPVILEVNAPLAEEQATHRGLAFRETARAIEGDVLRAADRVVAVSTALERWLVELGVDPARITVVRNGVDVERFAAGGPERSRMRKRLGAGEGLLVGFLGSLRAWHDVPALIEAVARLNRDGPHVRLVVIGDGPHRVELAERATSAGVDTIFTGAVPYERIPAYLAALDLAVAPYASSEQFYFSPLKLVEYLAAGLPVVAADVGDLAHCVRPGETGWLYPPGDVEALAEAMRAALGDELAARRLARAGRAHARVEHSWKVNAERLVELARAAGGSL